LKANGQEQKPWSKHVVSKVFALDRSKRDTKSTSDRFYCAAEESGVQGQVYTPVTREISQFPKGKKFLVFSLFPGISRFLSLPIARNFVFNTRRRVNAPLSTDHPKKSLT
jgi:hypothetical protein